MGTLQDIAARLARGSRGRTEADIQADVREFLLQAPLDLGETDLVVALEANAGGRKRIDIEAGCLAIEVKKSLSSPKVFDEARDQLTGYVKLRTEELGQRYVGVLTDGRRWTLLHLLPTEELAVVSQMRLETETEVPKLVAWLEVILATTQQIAPTPREILRRLGSGSPGFELDLADLSALYASCNAVPEVQLKRELWERLLGAALGTRFEATDELFVMHTYLVLVAELLAHAVVGLPMTTADTDTRALLEGEHFRFAGLRGVVEADFFDWPVVAPHGARVVHSIARKLSHFAWEQVEHDVLKILYESIIDKQTRQRLGEYYTPDWLAERIVGLVFTNPAEQKLLDPACGSGTFLFWAVRRALIAYEQAGLGNAEALARLVRHVHGIDLHPVAVTLARVTYLLAIGRERLADRGELTIPVFLADSVRWPGDDASPSAVGLRIRTSDPMELFDQELHFPEGVLQDPFRFDRLVADLAERAARRQPAPDGTRKLSIPSIKAILNRHKVDEADRDAIGRVFEKLCRLHDAGRNHVWGYYVRNLARPLAFTRPEGQVNVLVGNPPWLAYRYMPDSIQDAYRSLAEPRGLWAGGKVATNQDLSDLFVARAVEQYLLHGGRFSFVMPSAVLSRRQYAGFRTGRWGTSPEGATTEFAAPEDFARVKPPPFPMPACIVSGVKAKLPRALPNSGTRWVGRVRSHHQAWSEVSELLKESASAVPHALDPIEGSPYRTSFRQGATLLPTVLVRVELHEPGPLGLPGGKLLIRSARSALEKAPWRNLATLEGIVETQFVRPMHTGASIVSFRPRNPEAVVVPYAEGEPIEDEEQLEEYPGLASWWREAELLWNAHRTRSSKMTLLNRLDFQRLLRQQFPIAEHRVVYSASGQHLAACRIEDANAVIEHKLYWAAASSLDEARYLTAILNSGTLARLVAPLQSRGQHNPRDFDTHVFAAPFPLFDGSNSLHATLVGLAGRAEHLAETLDLEGCGSFQSARRMTREGLREVGVMTEIDEVVAELLAAGKPSRTGRAAKPSDSAPDLMKVLSTAEQKAGKRSPRKRRPKVENSDRAKPSSVRPAR